MGELDSVGQGLLEPRIGQGLLEPAIDRVLDLDRQRRGERLRDVGQLVLDLRLHVECVDDLDADPLGQWVDDSRLVDDRAHQRCEAVRLEGDLMRPDRECREEDRDARQDQRNPGEDAPAPPRGRLRLAGVVRRDHVVGHVQPTLCSHP